MSIADIIGTIGVAILLLGYFLNSYGFISAETKTYLMLNIIGSFTAGAASLIISFYPFVLLEGIWCLVSIIALVKQHYLSKPNHS